MFDVRAIANGSTNSLEHQRARRTAFNACQVLSRVDRTLTGDSAVSVTPIIQQGYAAFGGAPAWSFDGQVSIAMTHEVFGKLHGDAAFVHLLGLNHHELSHLLYTPAWGDVPALEKRASDEAGWANAYNMLEDGRIERLLGAEYESVRPMLLAVFLNMASITDTASSLWPITAPRKSILPKRVYRSIRKSVLAEKKFTQATVRKMEQIVSEYIDIVPVNDQARTLYLVDEYGKCCESSLTSGDIAQTIRVHMHGNGSVHPGQKQPRGKAGRTADEQTQLAKVAKQQDQQRDGEDDSDGESPSPSPGQGSGGGKDAAKAAQSDSDGSGKGDADQDADDADSGRTDESGDGDPVSGGGGGASNTGTGDDNATVDLGDLMNELGKAQNDILSSESVINELHVHSRAMRHGSSFISTKPIQRPAQQVHPTVDMTRAAKKIGVEFQKLQARLDPGWDRMTSAGKLNVKRYLEGAELDVVFDRWREDHSDASDVEAFLAMDLSSSMNSGARGSITPAHQAAQAFWVLRQALMSIGSNVTGYSFTTSASVLFSREDKSSKTKYQVWGASGGTNPETTIDDACVLLGRSKSKSKVFITLTDGDWAGDKDAMCGMLDEMRANGVVTCQYRIGGGRYSVAMTEIIKHFDVVSDITDPMAMVLPVKNTIKQLIKRKARS